MKKPKLYCHFILTAFFCVGSVCAYASSVFNTEGESRDFMNVYMSGDAPSVFAVAQDENGVIWLGTNTGLFSYDGFQLHEYLNSDGSEVGRIHSVAYLPGNMLCLGTDMGVRFFSLRQEKFIDEWTVQGGEEVRAFQLYKNQLFYGANGIYVYDLNTHTSKALYKNRSLGTIYSLSLVGHTLFVGSYNGLFALDLKSRQLQSITFPDTKRKRMVNSLLWDKQLACLWIGTEGNLYRYAVKDRKMARVDYQYRTSFKSLNIQGDDLIAGTDNGLLVMNRKQGQIRRYLRDSRNANSLSNNVVWSVFSDRQQNLWLGTDCALSFSHYSPYNSFVHITDISGKSDGNIISSIFVDKSGRYWLGGDNGLICTEPSGALRWYSVENSKAHIPHNRIRKIYQDKEGLIWIASDGGLLHLDEQSRRFVHHIIANENKKHQANWVYDLCEDDKGQMWVATYNDGLFVVNRDKLLESANVVATKNLLKVDGLADIVYQLQADSEGNMWLATNTELFRMNQHTYAIKPQGFATDNIQFDGKTHLIYSKGSALGWIHIKTSQRKEIDLSLVAGRRIHALLGVDSHIWFCGSDGIGFYSMQDKKSHILPLHRVGQRSLYFDPQKQLVLLGGEDGLFCISPTIATHLPKNGKVKILSILNNNEYLYPGVDYEGEAIRYRDELSLPYRYRNLSFEFSDLSYDVYGRYFYRLGNESEWLPVKSGSHVISFTDLNPGTYELQLKRAVYNEERNQTTKLTFTIAPPWYASIFMKFIYAVILLLFLLYVILYYYRRGKEKYQRLEKAKTLELAQLKIDFFTNMSHELKTPLSLILAPLSKMMVEARSSQQQQKLQGVYRNAQRLNEMIHNMLNFKSLESEGDDSLICSNVDLSYLFAEIIRNFGPLLEEKHIRLTFQGPSVPLVAYCDRVKMESVLVNIISNAVKFVPTQQGEIQVTLTKEEEQAHIVVRDNGIGIRPEEQRLIFVRFYQAKSHMQEKGTGIGLFLVKKYIEQHGGVISVDSTVGKGTVFQIHLPLHVAKTDVSFASADEMIQQGKRQATILVVDDNEEIVAFLVECLQQRYHCLKASDAYLARQVLQQESVDLLIVDEMMPGMSGMELCQLLKKEKATTTIPIIMLTAKDDMDTELSSIKAGVDAFMTKPFDVRKLMVRMEQLLRNRDNWEQIKKVEQIVEGNQNIIEVNSSDEVLLEKMVHHIEEHISDSSFNVSSLSEGLGLDAKMIYRKIKKMTGVTPVNLIRQIRMKRAAALFSQKKFSVSEVMYLVGFTNSSYFSKCFSEEFGMTPQEWIQKN